tara:strand:+ start:325 stop:795 length:471 start_codon:yes stop_codon:yes gene_type:complete
MPNWTYNSVQFVGKTEDSVKNLKRLLKSKDNDFDFNNIVPMPLALTETVSGSENAKPEWQKEQSEKLKKQHGFDNWYDWSIMNWGTKWNACDTNVELNKNVLNYTFDTAWDAPREIAKALLHMRNTILKDISIEWNCTHEDGNEEEELIRDGDVYE